MADNTLTIIYHEEDGTFWSESPDLPGFTAAGNSLGEVMYRTAQVLCSIR
jgi:predicted RNase H-like HicB family nuclease